MPFYVKGFHWQSEFGSFIFFLLVVFLLVRLGRAPRHSKRDQASAITVLRVCPVCGKKTLKSQQSCISCGAELPAEEAIPALVDSEEVEIDITPVEEISVLLTCPHCGQKTLRSRPDCLNCGRNISLD